MLGFRSVVLADAVGVAVAEEEEMWNYWRWARPSWTGRCPEGSQAA
ncbi:hypothetical protein ACFQZC_00920 [Streptacidiphilus monticola]